MLVDKDVCSDEPMQVCSKSSSIKVIQEPNETKPLAIEDFESLKPNTADGSTGTDAYTLFFGNNSWYLFFRLHNILCNRLYEIKSQTEAIIRDESAHRLKSASAAVALRLKQPNEIPTDQFYPVFLDMVKNLLDGNMESANFEDVLREMFGIHAYIVFTMDKLVQNIVRQLQHLVCDDSCLQSTELFLCEYKNTATGGPVSTARLRSGLEASYQRKAEQMLSDENCFKIIISKDLCKLTIELLDTDIEPSDEPIEVEKWNDYVEHFISPGEDVAQETKEHLVKKPIFLPRNVRTGRQRSRLANRSVTGDLNLPVSVVRENGLHMKQDTLGSTETGHMGKSDSPFLPADMILQENTECRLDLNSFKRVYVVPSEDYLYRKSALTRARKTHGSVCQRLHTHFRAFLQKWLYENVTESMLKWAGDFLMGVPASPSSLTTTVCTQYKTQLHDYYKYKVVTVTNTTTTTTTPVAVTTTTTMGAQK